MTQLKSKSGKENGFWVENPSPKIEKILLENEWNLERNTLPKRVNIPKRYVLLGTGLFGMWTPIEFDKVSKYLGKELIKQVEEFVKIY